MMFGRSWQAQVADYLMISRKTVSSWIERGSIPAWVEKEIKPLVVRRAKESKFALESLEMSEDDFYHNQAILNGEVFHYDCERYNFNDIQEFIKNQKWTVLDSAKYQIREKQPLESILQWVEDRMLSENDIASYLERNDAALDDLCEIQNMRGDACFDVRSDVEIIYERINK
jgi:predicted XRE-type DNA-binding protein